MHVVDVIRGCFSVPVSRGAWRWLFVVSRGFRGGVCGRMRWVDDRSDGDAPVLGAGSVLAGLEPFGWDSRGAVRYEVALEMFAQQAAVCSGRIAIEEAKTVPDPAVVARFRRVRSELAEARRGLDSTDVVAVGRVLDTARVRLAELRGL
jgi:hypothetical protein